MRMSSFNQSYDMVQKVLDRDVEFTTELFDIRAEETAFVPVRAIAPESRSQGQIAIVHLHGTMMMEDQVCGPRGTRSIASELSDLDQNPNIMGVILDVNSGGGQFQGTEHLAETIAKMQKPIVGHVIEAYSAAYMAVSACDYIYMQTKSAGVGSVGAMIGLYDMGKRMDDEGIKYVKIVSSHSPLKNKYNTDHMTDEDIEAIREGAVDPACEIGHDIVKNNRPQADKSIYLGEEYFAEQAITLGMADEIGGLDEAAMKVYELAQKQETQSTNIQSNKDMGLIDAIMGRSKEEKVTASQEEVAEVRAQLKTEFEAELQAKEDEVLNLQAQITEKDSHIQKLTSENEALTKKVEALSKAPAHEETGIMAEEVDVATKVDADKEREEAPKYFNGEVEEVSAKALRRKQLLESRKLLS